MCSATVSLIPGDYFYKYRNGWDYEVVDGLSCAVLDGDYWNRTLTVTSDSGNLPSHCFASCDDCPDVISGCMDSAANNYNPAATEDDGSCTYPAPMVNLFFSEYGEGSSYNKHLEIFNPSDDAVSLADYKRVNCSNGCDDWEYDADFAEGAFIEANGVYVLCDSGVGEDFPSAECDASGALYFNGDDAQGLIYLPTGELLDIIGEQIFEF